MLQDIVFPLSSIWLLERYCIFLLKKFLLSSPGFYSLKFCLNGLNDVFGIISQFCTIDNDNYPKDFLFFFFLFLRRIHKCEFTVQHQLLNFQAPGVFFSGGGHLCCSCIEKYGCQAKSINTSTSKFMTQEQENSP